MIVEIDFDLFKLWLLFWLMLLFMFVVGTTMECKKNKDVKTSELEEARCVLVCSYK